MTLAAALESRSDRAVKLRFEVSDTGIGVRPEQAAMLFQPFTQADASTTRRYGGTGLGLAISKQLVELMGGTIAVDSREGQGCTFRFTVTFEVAQPSQQQLEGERTGRPFDAIHQIKPPQRNARILIAEDNAVNRAVALAQLKKLGYKASAVANGAQVIEALRQGGHDLVLMDCQMPVMDGFEATRRIRLFNPSIPIIALTADAMPTDRDRCLREGMNDYLAKPVDLEQLANMLVRSLPASGAGEQTEAVFDEAALLHRLMGDRELAGIILKGFIDDVPSQLHRLRVRLDEADAPGTRLQAHALKGAAATVAAEGLQAIAFAMEQAGTSGQLDRCVGLLPRAVEEFERYKGALELAGWV